MVETISLGVGEKRVYDVADGETFSNVIVDQRAEGACLTIRAADTAGWTIRNVGFLGVGERGGGTNAFQMQVSVPPGESGLIENCYLYGKADGEGAPADGTQLGGIYARASHAGHIDVRHTYIEGFGNNAAYMSAPGKDNGRDGSTVFENCFHRDNTVSQYRIGTPGSEVRNCVGVVDDPEGLRGPYPGTQNRSARGVWGKHFDGPRVVDSAFVTMPDDVWPSFVFHARYINTERSHGSAAVLYVDDCDVNPEADRVTGSTEGGTVVTTNIGQEPVVAVIQDGGVPTSPQMAADGLREYPAGPPELGTGDLPSAIEELEEEIDRLQAELAACNDQVATLQAEVDTLTAENIALEDEVAALEDENTSLRQQVTDLQAENDALEQQVATLEADKTDLEQRVLTLEQKIDAAQEALR